MPKRRRDCQAAALLRTFDNHIKRLNPPPKDPEAMRRDLIAMAELYFDVCVERFGCAMPEGIELPAHPDHASWEAIWSNYDEDCRRVSDMHNPLNDAPHYLLPTHRLIQLILGIKDLAVTLSVGPAPEDGASIGRPMNDGSARWPDGAVDDLLAAMREHLQRVQDRYRVEPFGPVEEAHEFIELLKMLFDFADRWRLVVDPANVAFHVRQAFRNYRLAVLDPERPLPPPDDALGLPAAIYHLENAGKRVEEVLEAIRAEWWEDAGNGADAGKGAQSNTAADTAADTAAGGTATDPTTAKLTDLEATTLEIIRALPPHRCILGPKLVAALADRGITTCESTLTSDVIPKLKKYYRVKNIPRVGYYCDGPDRADARPTGG